MDPENDPLDAGLSAAFGRSAPPSVMTVLEQKIGDAPRVSLREGDSAATGGTPLIDPGSEERRSLPHGRATYQLMGEIARGGMGVVLRGHDTDLGRDVALKVLHRKLADDPAILQRFVEEAQIGGQLQHPGIVPVYELGLMADERPYFTMKLVKGRTLAALLAERSSPAADRRRMLDVFHSVCQTMAYAHSRGVIHRDLKPSNVMVGAFGEVQVVDWGLAKILARGGTADEERAREAHSIHTVLETVRSTGSRRSGTGSDSLAGSIMGTPSYMPPEQAQGRVEKLDERSDVFALGAILCEILTGAPPYRGERQEALAAAARADLGAALARIDASQADPELIELARQTLFAAPEARPRNAAVVAERIAQHLEDAEERVRAAQVDAAVQRRARKLTVALAATIVAATLGIGGGWLLVQSQAFERERAADARDREIAASVNALLEDSASLRGQGRFDEALDRAERAQALAEGGGAGEELSSRIEKAVAVVASARADADRRDALMTELLGVLSPEEDWTYVDRRYREIFQEHGVDLERGAPEELAESLIALGLGSRIDTVLDRWLVASTWLGNEAWSQRLLDVTYVIDPDPFRSDLRAAVIDGAAAELVQKARGRLAARRPATLLLLGLGLARVNEDAECLRVLRESCALYPDDVALHSAVLSLTFESRKIEAMILHGPAVGALLPRDRKVTWYGALRLQEAGDGAREKDPELARIYYAESAAHWAACAEASPDDAELHHRLALNAERAGWRERAMGAYRRALELARDEPWIEAARRALAELEGRDDDE